MLRRQYRRSQSAATVNCTATYIRAAFALWCGVGKLSPGLCETKRKEFAMRMPIARIMIVGLVLSAARVNQPDSLGADATGQTNAKPERLIDIKTVLSVLTAFAERPIQDMAGALTVVAEAQEIQSLEWTKMKPLLAAVQERFGPANVWFARPNGSYFSVDKGLADKNLRDRPYFAKVMAGELSIGELVVSRSTGANTVVTAVPIKRDGQVVGMLGISLFGQTCPTNQRNDAIARGSCVLCP